MCAEEKPTDKDRKCGKEYRRAKVEFVGSADAYSEIAGTLYMKEEEGGTLMSGKVTGLVAGTHPLHVHEYGCLSEACMKTGAHYNPRNAVFELGNANGYIGNLDAIVADSAGGAEMYQLFKNLPLKGA